MKLSSFFKGKSVFITGNTGFIGSWISKWLIMFDSNVAGYSIGPPSNPNLYDAVGLGNDIEDVRGDVRDYNKLMKTIYDIQPDLVLHLAAQPIVLDSYENPEDTFSTNVMGTVNLLNALLKVGSSKEIIVMTSDKVYQNLGTEYHYREIDPLGGNDPYSASKSCQDIIASSYWESYFNGSGVGVSRVRSGNVMGGGDWGKFRIIPDIVDGIVNNKKIKIRNPSYTRPWVHVLDVAYGILTLAQRMNEDIDLSGAWNFGPLRSQRVTVKHLVSKFTEIWGKGNYETEGREEFKEASNLALDASKANRRLFWKPSFNFESALGSTVSWYKSFYGGANAKEITENQIMKYPLGDE